MTRCAPVNQPCSPRHAYGIVLERRSTALISVAKSGMSLTSQPPTVLDKRYFEPFDRTYADVTKGMMSAAARLSGADRDWLYRLIDTFATERTLWNRRPELDDYRRRWRRLRTRFVRLAAGAYLHISYDLPRAIADDWPGKGSWSHGPTELRGEQIYSEIRDVFPRTLRRVSRDARISGWLVAVLAPLSTPMLAPLGTWLLHLRIAAWSHARILATQPNRALREQAMALAVSAALEDASDFRPWRTALLQPPDHVLYTPIWAGLVAVLLSWGPVVATIGLAAGVAFLVSELRIRTLLRSVETMLFVQDLAERLLDYVDVAVHNPEEFASYLANVRSQQGLASRDGGNSAPVG